MTLPDSSYKNALAVKYNHMYIATAANNLNDILCLEAPNALIRKFTKSDRILKCSIVLNIYWTTQNKKAKMNCKCKYFKSRII